MLVVDASVVLDEQCALAELLRCPVVTRDARLRSAGARLGYVVTPVEAVALLS